MDLIELRDYSFTYALGEKKALSGLTFSVRNDETLLLCGASGSGKTTLLNCLKPELLPAGTHEGALERRIQSGDIGVLFQEPDAQLVVENVRHNLAFAMENLGVPRSVMQKRMAETVGFFGIEALLEKNVNALSGGEKQMIALCAALLTRPRLLLLDEPLSQLDPIAAQGFIAMLARVREEFRVSMVITGHRMDELLPFANRILLLERGEIARLGAPDEVLHAIWESQNPQRALFVPDIPLCAMALGMPPVTAPGLCKGVTPAPDALKQPAKAPSAQKKQPALEAKDLLYSYGGAQNYVLKRLDLKVSRGEFLCVMGGNGSGKTTLLKLLYGMLKPRSGVVHLFGQAAGYMPQNIQVFFLAETLAQEFAAYDPAWESRRDLLEEFGLSGAPSRHPYDLSAGEQHMAALFCLLLKKCGLLLLDEPTKGLDPYAKRAAARAIKACGASVIACTHDMAFAAENADRCALLFDGDICAAAGAREFFAQNWYYTTQVHKAFGYLGESIITKKDVFDACGIQKPSFLPD